MRFTSGSVLVVCVFILILWASPAPAELVTVEVTGRVTFSNFPAIGFDSLVSGYYSYDDTTPDSRPNAYNGQYYPVTFGLTFVDGSAVSTSDAYIWVNNNSSGYGTIDEYAVYFPGDVLGAPSLNTLTGSFAEWDLGSGSRIYRSDSSGVAWDSDALPDPQSVLSLLPFDGSRLHFTTFESADEPRVELEITGLSVVPLPGAFVLAGLGLSSAGWLLRRRNATA